MDNGGAILSPQQQPCAPVVVPPGVEQLAERGEFDVAGRRRAADPVVPFTPCHGRGGGPAGRIHNQAGGIPVGEEEAIRSGLRLGRVELGDLLAWWGPRGPAVCRGAVPKVISVNV